MFFTSPMSNITPAQASIAMSRSDSRDSTTSFTYTSSQGCSSAYEALAMSTSPAWPVTSHPLARTDSNTSSTPSTSANSSHPTSTAMRRGSSSGWLPSPYRSCLNATVEEPSSYLSDDDLLFLCPPDSLPIQSIPNPQPKKELTTEEQIAMLREMQEKEYAQLQQMREQQQRRKTVRFDVVDSSRKSRRPSTLRRRTTAARKGLSQLNGPQ